MKNLIIIFTKNPIEGKVKTRLAKTIGAKNAVEIYKLLIEQTQIVTKNLNCEKHVYYADFTNLDDSWDNKLYTKKIQIGDDLGHRMENSFKEGFELGFEKIVIIGTDLWDLQKSDIELAFKSLDNSDVCIGPAIDGGYYLLGLKNKIPLNIFKNKEWSTSTVFSDTLNDIKNLKVSLLNPKNDIDEIDDLLSIKEFEKYLN